MAMTDHPITPPPELYKQWEGKPRSLAFEAAYRAGADAELEACCEWLKAKEWIHPEFSDELRTARRPPPPSLAEQALKALLHTDQGQHNERAMIIRRALERLQELENNG